MLNGHAYARAVRAHMLLQLTLAIIVSKDLVIDDEMVANLNITIENFNQKLKEYEERGPTAKLWIQYFHKLSIAKEFIRAERMGNFQAHLNSIIEMFPYFHASGHFPYDKSAHLYLQDMLQLENLLNPSVYQRFIERFFTVRRSDKLNSGSSTDTVYGMHAMNTICEGLEDLADVRMDTTDQHASDSRVKKYAKDIKKLLEWFSSHDHFPEVKEIISIASGVVGDNKINYHKAREVGIASMSKMTGKTFNNIKLKLADKVLRPLTMSSTIKVHDEKVSIDPVLLFQRMSITKTFKDEIEKFFEYKLAPYLLSLFDAFGIRKTQKSAIYDCFQSVNIEIDNINATYIIDGGCLLHSLVWDREETFNVIFDKYVQKFRNGRDKVENQSHKRRPATSVNEDNIQAVCELVESDRRITVTEIASEEDISVESVHTVILNTLGYRKISARWVPRLLSEAQKNVRKDICHRLLSRFEQEGEAFLDRISTCDETWIHHYTPENKRSGGKVEKGHRSRPRFGCQREKF
ncbi:hypothetical protein NQ314_019129 [Rhamnusium bicolor]|uniref:Transposase n=1 Tax=Rhamnusium bicolor TaxID=1586634 RepID=A0AAV8WQ90_9CUCU|nr:hypothetical protein NQ314_019129 [Rhamnusium bicolor]